MSQSYLPVQWVYREVIEEQMAGQSTGKIFYFDQEEKVAEATGRIQRMEERPDGVFIMLDTGEELRIDRIITLYGKPGAAYDEYESFANACLDCMGGYTKEELEKM